MTGKNRYWSDSSVNGARIPLSKPVATAMPVIAHFFGDQDSGCIALMVGGPFSSSSHVETNSEEVPCRYFGTGAWGLGLGTWTRGSWREAGSDSAHDCTIVILR